MKKFDLTKANYQDLINELNNRGYYTDLIVGIGDVEKYLEEINDERDEKITLSEEQKREVLISSFNTDGFLDSIAECIQETILRDFE